MEQKVIQVGNSIGIVIPQQLRTGFKPGDKVVVEKDTDGTILVNAYGKKHARSSVTPAFFSIVEKVNKRYAAALRELANK